MKGPIVGGTSFARGNRPRTAFSRLLHRASLPDGKWNATAASRGRSWRAGVSCSLLTKAIHFGGPARARDEKREPASGAGSVGEEPRWVHQLAREVANGDREEAHPVGRAPEKAKKKR